MSNYLVIKFHDNDFTHTMLEAIKQLKRMCGEEFRDNLEKAHKKGMLKNILHDAFYGQYIVSSSWRNMRLSQFRNYDPVTIASDRERIHKWLSGFTYEFYQNSSQFNQEWRNSEWIWYDLNRDESGLL